MVGSEAKTARPLIQVACGVLVDTAGQVLMAQRPAGKIAEGYWEFPGGKIEPGETPEQALVRELQEELGVEAERFEPLIDFTHHYRDRIVRLRTYCITQFRGQVHGREGQAFAWRTPAQLFDLQPQLPTVTAIHRALRLPARYVWTAPVAEGCAPPPQRIQVGDLVRLRQPAWSADAYAAAAPAWVAAIRAQGGVPVLDGERRLAGQLGTGLHLTAAQMRCWQPEGDDRPWPLLGSAHDADEVAQAALLDLDAVVIGHVGATPSHPDVPPLGWMSFAGLARSAGRPAYAIGGVSPGDAEIVRQHGGQGVAAIRAYQLDEPSSGGCSGSTGAPASR